MKPKEHLMGSDPQQFVLSLIDDIYSAALDPSQWQNVVKRFVQAVGGETGQLHSNSKLVLDTLWSPYGFGEEVMGLYAQYFHQYDEWTLGADRGGLPACKAITGEGLVEFGDFRGTEFYNDFLKGFGFERLVCCYVDPGLTGDMPKTALCAYRPPGSEPFEPQALQLIDIIAPHVRRAVQLHWRIHDLEHHSATRTEALEHLKLGVALINESCKVTYLNRAAQAMIAARDGVSLINSELTAAVGEETLELSRILGESTRITTAKGDAFGHEIALSRPSGRPPYRVNVISVPRRGAFTVGRQHTASIAFIAESGTDMQAGIEAVAKVYGLSPAERRLLAVMVHGATLKQVAKRLGVSPSTAHTQLKSIFRRTDTHRQAELVALVGRLAGVHGGVQTGFD